MKTKGSEKKVRAFLTKIAKKNRVRKHSLDKGKKIAGVFEIVCKEDGRQNYYTMSETKATVAERTLRSLIKNVEPILERFWYKYFHKITQFFTTLKYGEHFRRLDTEEC